MILPLPKRVGTTNRRVASVLYHKMGLLVRLFPAPIFYPTRGGHKRSSNLTKGNKMQDRYIIPIFISLSLIITIGVWELMGVLAQLVLNSQ